jgi:hypothetical protein
VVAMANPSATPLSRAAGMPSEADSKPFGEPNRPSENQPLPITIGFVSPNRKTAEPIQGRTAPYRLPITRCLPLRYESRLLKEHTAFPVRYNSRRIYVTSLSRPTIKAYNVQWPVVAYLLTGCVDTGDVSCVIAKMVVLQPDKYIQQKP